MALPDNIYELIEKEIHRTRDDGFIHMIRRKGKTAKYDPLPEKRWGNYLSAWNDFHKEVAYNSFQSFYSKSSFCSSLERRNFPQDDEKARELFLSLLADQNFLFLEYSEHLAEPAILMSEIIRTPKQYLESQNEDTKKYAELVLRQGFVPTAAHAGAYDQMCENLHELNQAICRRERCRAKDQEWHQPLEKLYQVVQIRIEPSKEQPTALETALADLFQAYLASTAKNAYTPNYQEFSELPQSNYLPAIHTVMEHLNRYELRPYSALVLFHLFTQRTKKLALGRLKDYNFTALRHQTRTDPPQEIVQRRTEHKIMLFDYLLQLLRPDDLDYVKYLFCQYTQYNGYYHFYVPSYKDIKEFSCLPNHNDSVDQLGGEFRRHIRSCIPNDVSWLIPDLPNDREVNSIALATFLLRDAEYLPVYTRLTDRIRRLLHDREVANKMIVEYQNAYIDQKKTLELLKSWCLQYGLEFIGADSFLDLRTQRSEAIRQMCGRFVLEHMLRERIYSESQQNLAQIAQALFGELCLEGEVFQPF